MAPRCRETHGGTADGTNFEETEEPNHFVHFCTEFRERNTAFRTLRVRWDFYGRMHHRAGQDIPPQARLSSSSTPEEHFRFGPFRQACEQGRRPEIPGRSAARQGSGTQGARRNSRAARELIDAARGARLSALAMTIVLPIWHVLRIMPQRA